MAKEGKPFRVDTRPTKDIVVNGLTRDASVEACIFDLIDNAIDAARDSIFKRSGSVEPDELPDSYKGYEIKLYLTGTSFRIEDNCGGIPVDKLQNLVLRFGERSAHPVGIGTFGVGLNRALFKLGKVSRLSTDTGNQRAELTLDVERYLAEKDEWQLPARELDTTGQAGTEIEINGLPGDIARDFSDKDWVTRLRHNVARRFGHFISKKLKILVNGTGVKSEEVKIRENPPVEYEGDYKFYKTNGVAIHVRYGQHEKHRFSNEKDYDKSINDALTSEYGWNVLCNDRTVLFSDQSRKTGWDTKLHSEHYGFVGIVSFVGDPEKLPWTTTKTDVDLNNEAYGSALAVMRQYAEKWRATADRRKKSKKPPRQLPPKKKKSAKASSTKAPARRTTKSEQPVSKVDHNEFRTVLPEDINEEYSRDKHLTLVHEAKKLDLDDLAYSGLALIRMLFETSTIAFLSRHNRYSELVDFVADKLEKKLKKQSKVLSDEDRKKIVPKLDDILPFFHNHPELWGAAKAPHLKHSLSNMAKYQSRLNSALHNPFQPIHKSEAFQIRDEVLPMLRHLIET